MSDTPRTARWPLWGWYPLALQWFALLLLLALLTVFRTLKNIGSASLIQFDDVPILHYFNLNYGKLFWGTTGLAAFFLCGLAAACWFMGHNRPGWPWQAWRSRSPRAWVAAWLPIAAAAFVALALFECRYRGGELGAPAEVHGAGAIGWLIVALAGAAGWLFTRAVVLTPQGSAARRRRPCGAAVPAAEADAAVEKTGVRAQETGVGSEESGDRSQESGDRRQESGNGSREGDVVAAAGADVPYSVLRTPYSAGAAVPAAPASGTPAPQARYPAAPAGETPAPRAASWASWLGCLATVFLLCLAVAYVEAALAHREFWDQEKNGNHNYKVYFAAGESDQANLVLHSTSLLFASLAAVGGCVCFGVFHLVLRGSPALSRRDMLWIVALAAALWTFALGVPWQIKLLPEIKAEGWQGLLFANIVLVFLMAGLAPLLAVTLAMLRQTVGQVAPRPSEFALWTAALFPVYPLVAWLPLGNRRVRYGFLMVVSAAVLACFMYAVACIEEWFDFDDWRGMVKGAELPFLRVFASLLVAYAVYAAARRAGLWADRLLARSPRLDGVRWVRLPAQAVLTLVAAACFCFATWPFWGWNGVSKNALARCVEFNKRHKFELGFLHWLFDCDRDGYAAVLHGADYDDFDSTIQAGGLGPPEKDAVIPVDRFAIDDDAKAERLPNLAIFYLEGVNPRAIGAYGQRWRRDKDGYRVPWRGPDGPTPHIDSVAAEGTIFTQARCFYPSTWDAWYATSTGRFMRIAEMHAAELFGDRYSPHNNLYKVLHLAGFDRWCHSNTDPYNELLVPRALHEGGKPPWEPDFDSRVSRSEDAREVWRGDKRADRMVAFLDSIRPGERFFLCEHLADTHFPWKRTAIERAKELGFPKGLELYEEDAVLPGLGAFDPYNRYFQTITRMDAQIGRVLQKLRERKLYDNTMIVVVSDHGCQWWEHDDMYYVSHVYEQSLLVPLIVRLPPAAWEQYGFTSARRARQYDGPVLQVDVLPTLMELAGARHRNAEATGPLPGRSLLPAMFSNGKSKAELDALAEGYRRRDVPLMTHYDMRGVIHDARYKLIFYRPLGTYLVFDLEEDPKEMKNLADERPELLDDLMARLRVLFTENKTLLGSMKEDEHWRP